VNTKDKVDAEKQQFAQDFMRLSYTFRRKRTISWVPLFCHFSFTKLSRSTSVSVHCLADSSESIFSIP
jgi:hypothetical protein